jgi:transmembrane sensor
MTDSDPFEQERLFLASLTRSLTEAEELQLQSSPIDAKASLTGTWLAMSAIANSDEIQAMRADALEAAGALTSKRRPRSYALPIGIAACLALVAAGFTTLWSMNQVQTYSAPARGIAHFTLADGTQVTLSARGELRSRMGRSKREIELKRGDAYFAVVHDERRPLTVTNGVHRIVDLGTEFNVSQASGVYKVTLLSGALQVRNLKTGYSRELAPGQSYTETPKSEQITDDSSGNVASWAHGQLVFEDASLDQVGAAFARLTGRHFIFGAPELSELRLSGNIDIEHVDRACRALSAALPVKATSTAQGDVLISGL